MARPRKEIPAGTVINRLTVIGPGEAIEWGNGWHKSTSVVRCECGTIKTIANSQLKTGKIKSCGCFLAVAIGQRARTHGLSVGEWVDEYSAWNNMHERCYNPENSQYDRYGGRGITVCERWHLVQNFVADMGHKPSREYTLDRINNAIGYSPENCRWADKKTQAVNRRTTKIFTVDGVAKCIKDWAREWGVSRHVAGKRLREMQCQS